MPRPRGVVRTEAPGVWTVLCDRNGDGGDMDTERDKGGYRDGWLVGRSFWAYRKSRCKVRIRRRGRVFDSDGNHKKAA